MLFHIWKKKIVSELSFGLGARLTQVGHRIINDIGSANKEKVTDS